MFKQEDAMFFCKDKEGCLRLLHINATKNQIITAYGSTPKLDNKKIVGKEFYKFWEHNRDEEFTQFGRWGVNSSSLATRLEIKSFLPDFQVYGNRKDVTADNISLALKFAARALEYPFHKKALQSDELTFILFVLGDPTPCHWQSIATGTYKRWGVRGVRYSKDISWNNCIAFQKEDLQQ